MRRQAAPLARKTVPNFKTPLGLSVSTYYKVLPMHHLRMPHRLRASVVLLLKNLPLAPLRLSLYSSVNDVLVPQVIHYGSVSYRKCKQGAMVLRARARPNR